MLKADSIHFIDSPAGTVYHAKTERHLMRTTSLKMKIRNLVIVLLASVLTFVLAATSLPAAGQDKPAQSVHPAAADNITTLPAPTVLTKYGQLAATAGRGNSWTWKGVPYARPPVGDLRWRAPQPPQAWDGVRQSTDQFDMATQMAMSKTWIPQGNIVGGEDCLYLNIWRPQGDGKDLPVYVYFHGGANNFGSARLYDGSAVASISNMVVVVPQYRLGPLGWFNLPALREGVSAEEASGNLGTLDTIQALRWVRENISAFGGDPDNVTIAGQSAGGHNIMNLLISPLGRGLFQRVLCESAGLNLATMDEGAKMANTTVENLLIADGKAVDRAAAAAMLSRLTNAETAAYLRAKSASQIIRAQINDRGSMEFHPAYVDGTVIPAGLLEAIGSGNYNRVPIILGSNADEARNFLPLMGGNFPTSNFHHWSDLYEVLDGKLALEEVMPLKLDRDIYWLAGYLSSRNFKAVHVDTVARRLKEKQDDVYCYLFKWGGPGSGPAPYDFIFGAAHAVEIPFFFGWPRDAFGYAFTEENRPGREALQKAMMAYAAQFAWAGDPNLPGAGLTAWLEWSNAEGGPKCMVFDASLTEAKLGMMYTEVAAPRTLQR